MDPPPPAVDGEAGPTPRAAEALSPHVVTLLTDDDDVLFQQLMDRLSDVQVSVTADVAAIDFDASDGVYIFTADARRYAAVAADLRTAAGDRQLQVHHVAQALDLAGYLRANVAAVLGLPGCGNVLVHHLLTKLYDSAGLPPQRPSEPPMQIVAKVFANHFDLIEHVRRSIDPLLPLERPSHQNFRHRGGSDIVFPCANDQFVMVRNLEGLHDVNSVVHSTHECPTVADLAFYRARGYECLSPVRDPLDVLISNLRKLDPRHPDPDAQLSAELQDLELFADLCMCVVTYLSRLLKVRLGLRVIRYEDALSKPVDFVDALARAVGIEPTLDVLHTLPKDIGTRALAPPGTGHFFRPGIGKWRSFLDQRHYSILLELGVFDLMESWGYPAPQQDEFRVASSAATVTGRAAADWAVVHDRASILRRRLYLLMAQTYGHDEMVALTTAGRMNARVRLGPLDIVASDPSLAAAVERRLGDAGNGLLDSLLAFHPLQAVGDATPGVLP